MAVVIDGNAGNTGGTAVVYASTGVLPAVDGSALTNLPVPAKLSTASGSAPSYSARAWVNFNGTGTPAIRASGNVTSITDNGTGDYTVNFTTSMPDTSYVVVGTGSRTNDSNCTIMILDSGTPYTTGGITVRSGSPAQGTYFDGAYINVAVFR